MNKFNLGEIIGKNCYIRCIGGFPYEGKFINFDKNGYWLDREDCNEIIFVPSKNVEVISFNRYSE